MERATAYQCAWWVNETESGPMIREACGPAIGPMKRLAVSLLALTLSASSAAAWSSPAHQAIGEAAQSRLTPQAAAALARILQDTDTLSPGARAGVATWADDIRARQRFGTVAEGWGQAEIAEADKFNSDHPE